MPSLRTLYKKVKRSQQLRKHFNSLKKNLRPCPLCRHGHHETLAKRDRNGLGLITVACHNCGFIFTNPFLTDAGLDDFYSKDYRDMTKGHIEATSLLESRPWMSIRADYFADKISVGLKESYLDIGCGEGSLPIEIRRRFPELSMSIVEPNGRYRAFAAKQTQSHSFESVNIVNREFDSASSIHVLEHTLEPITFLKQVANVLIEGATFFVDVPDAKRYTSLSDLHIAHCNHFSQTSLRFAFEAAGFEIISITPHDPPHLPPSLWVEARNRNTAMLPALPQRDKTAEAGIKRANQTYWGFGVSRLFGRDKAIYDAH